MNFPYQSDARVSGIRNRVPSSEPIRRQSTASHRSSSDIRRTRLVPDARTAHLCPRLHRSRIDGEPRLFRQQRGSWIDVRGRELLCRGLGHLCSPNFHPLPLVLVLQQNLIAVGLFSFSVSLWVTPIPLHRTTFECARLPTTTQPSRP